MLSLESEVISEQGLAPGETKISKAKRRSSPTETLNVAQKDPKS